MSHTQPASGARLANLYFWLGLKTASDLSSAMISVLLATYIHQVTGSSFLLGLVLALQLAGSVCGGLLMPRLHNMTRRDVILLAEFGAAFAIGMLALAPHAWDALLIYIAPPLLGMFLGMFRVAIMAEIPSLTGQEGRHRLNAILSASDGLAFVGGSLLAAVIVRYFSFKQLFLIDALTFLLSGISFLILRRGLPSAPADSLESRFKHFSGHVFAYLTTLMLLVIAARFVEAFGSGTHNVGFPLKSSQFDPLNPSFLYGWILASWGLGRLLAALCASRILHKLEAHGASLEMFFVLMLVLTFGAFMWVFRLHALHWVLLLAVLAGLFDAITETTYYSVLQMVAENMRNRVISLSYVTERAGLALGMVSVGWIYGLLPVEQTASWFYGMAMATGSVMLLMIRQQHWKKISTQALEAG